MTTARATGIQGAITTWGVSPNDVYQLVTVGMAAHTCKVNIKADKIDVTGQGDYAQSNRTGKRSWDFTFDGYLTKAARQIGNLGLVTFASGFVLNCDEWEMDLSFNALDISGFSDADTTWRYFMPGNKLMASGTFAGYASVGTGLSLPLSPSATGTGASVATFQLGTAYTLAAKIVADQVGLDIPIGADGSQRYNYAYGMDGAATGDRVTIVSPSTNTGFFPDGVVDQPDWQSGTAGVCDTPVVITSAPSRTYTGTAFWKSIKISVKKDQPIKISGTGQGSGPLVIA